jgi:hypothetical protein
MGSCERMVSERAVTAPSLTSRKACDQAVCGVGMPGFEPGFSGPPAEPASSRLIPIAQGLSLLIRGNRAFPSPPIPPVSACFSAICDQYVISGGDKGSTHNLLVNPLWWAKPETSQERGGGSWSRGWIRHARTGRECRWTGPAVRGLWG